MSTTPITTGSTTPEVPLSPAVRGAYEAQYAYYEGLIENTNDPDLKASLMSSQDDVAQVISLDNVAKIQQTTASYEALLKQIKKTNDGLDDLQKQIRKTASDLSLYGGILGGIATVLKVAGV